MENVKKLILILVSLLVLNSCGIFEDLFTDCNEDQAIWGTASSQDTPKEDNCAELSFVFTNSGTLINGVSLSAIIAYTGDGPKAMALQFQLTTGTDIRDYDFKNALKISYDKDAYEFRTNNADFAAYFDAGFNTIIYEKVDIEIDQKRRDKENYRGHIKCEGLFQKGWNGDGSIRYVPFSYDLQFDTKNK